MKGIGETLRAIKERPESVRWADVRTVGFRVGFAGWQTA